MLSNGLASVIQKYHQSAYPGLYQVDFMLLAMVVAAIPTVFPVAFQKGRHIQFSILGISSGLLNGLANFIVLLLSADQDATVLFPLISAGNVVAAWLTGIIIFKEHIKFRQIIGLLFGIMGIVLLTYK
jgi:multidrug transporter EmrE-like cation transporter